MLHEPSKPGLALRPKTRPGQAGRLTDKLRGLRARYEETRAGAEFRRSIGTRPEPWVGDPVGQNGPTAARSCWVSPTDAVKWPGMIGR